MEKKEICKELSSLVQLDIDAVHAYELAITNIEPLNVREQLTQFKNDHHRHIGELSTAIRQYGEQPPSYSPDFKGFLIQGFTAIRSATGTEGALKAMKTNEELTNRTYLKALGRGFPPDVRAIVERNYADEQRHLRSIEQWIATRVWEQQPGAAP
jgi:uncharacterized protein (TIGR02284 family)